MSGFCNQVQPRHKTGGPPRSKIVAAARALRPAATGGVTCCPSMAARDTQLE